jgi:hypothetical protein
MYNQKVYIIYYLYYITPPHKKSFLESEMGRERRRVMWQAAKASGRESRAVKTGVVLGWC